MTKVTLFAQIIQTMLNYEGCLPDYEGCLLDYEGCLPVYMNMTDGKVNVLRSLVIQMISPK